MVGLLGTLVIGEHSKSGLGLVGFWELLHPGTPLFVAPSFLMKSYLWRKPHMMVISQGKQRVSSGATGDAATHRWPSAVPGGAISASVLDADSAALFPPVVSHFETCNKICLGKWTVADLSVGYQTRVRDPENKRVHQRVPRPRETLLGECEAEVRAGCN